MMVYKRAVDKIVWAVLFLAAFSTIFITISIVLIQIYESWGFFKEVSTIEFLTGTEWTPMFVTKKFGVLPLLAGTFLTTIIALLVAAPMGILISIYLSEFAPDAVRETVKPAVEFLAGIPTVVYGYFALLFLTPLLEKVIPDLESFNALSAGIAIGIMILPYTSSITEDVMRAVPQALREASYAFGASKIRTAFSVIMPASSSGIAAAYILGISRALGETMTVSIAAGMFPNFTANPLEPIQTITSYIVQVSLGDSPHGSLQYQTIFAVGLLLALITLLFNTIAYWLKTRIREVY
jgi:phosphate transport system permease protein